MKKLLKIFSLGLVFSVLFAGFSSASNNNDCIRRTVGNNSICVAINKGNNNRYTFDSEIYCRDDSCAVACSILLPDDTLNPVGACDGKFYYNSNSSEKVKLYITINSNFATITRYYNFRNGTWGSAIDDDDWDYDDDDDRDYDDDDYDRDYDWDDDYYDYDYNWNYSSEMNRAYQYAYRYNITTKRSIEAAGMNQQLTRIAMAKMLSQYAINVLGKRPANVYVPKFSDVSTSLDAQYDNGVTLAYQLGIMGQNMPNNKFRPYDTVTRAEFATALSRLLFNTKDGKDVYYSTHLNRLYREGIITNTNPNLKELRGYVMIMLMRSADIDIDYDYDDNYELEISTNNKNPSTSEYIRLTIDTDDDYYGKITLTAKYRSSTSSSRTSVSNTSSTYFSNYSDEWEQGYYKMKSSDNGHKVISNFLKFAKKGYYRIYAKDTYGNEDYIDFYVGDPSSSDNEVELSTNKSNPSTSEWVNLTIDTDDDYVGNISFYKVQYRSSSSDSWSTISSRTNSTYFSNYSDEWEQGYYRMKSSDNGHKVISNFLKFAKKGYYRIYAKDVDGNYDYIDFNVGNPSSSDNEVELSTNKTNPSTSEWINLTIDTDDDYVGNISFYKVQYRSSTSNSWTTISSRTDSTYFSNYSDEWEQGYYKMKSSDDGHKVISNFLKFAKKGYYRIYAKDVDGNYDYIDFNVGGLSSTDNEVELSANKTNPSTSEWIRLTINTDNDYVGNISFYKVQYKSSSSSSWSTIYRTDSTYFSNYSDEWKQGYYKMKSSDDGHKVISNFLKFAKKGYYRIYAKDVDGNYDYIDFNVGGSSSSSNDLELGTNDESPSASEYVDLTVETDSSYRGKVNFSAKYRSSTSNSWTDISRTNSNYFINRSTTWNNGYVTMTSSDHGEKTVENIFKFAKKGYYRIIAEDEDGNTTYLDFNVGYSSTSPLVGFTWKEFEMIERIYNVWPTLISKLKSEYPRLRNNTTWKNLSDDLYENMGDVVHKRSNREFQDYDDFDRSFRYWFNRTQDLMD